PPNPTLFPYTTLFRSFPIAAVHTAETRKGPRTPPAPKGTAPPSPTHNLPSEQDAAARLEFVSPPANPFPTVPRPSPIAHTTAHLDRKSTRLNSSHRTI